MQIMANNFTSLRCPTCGSKYIQDPMTLGWFCPKCNPHYLPSKTPTSNIYYTDENGSVKSIQITSSRFSDNIPHSHRVMETSGTKGREYKSARKYRIVLGSNKSQSGKYVNEETQIKTTKVKYRIASEKEIYNIISKWFVDGKKPVLSAVNKAFKMISDDMIDYFVKTLKVFIHDTGKKIQDDRPKKKNNKDTKETKSKKDTKPKQQTNHPTDTYKSSLGGIVQYNHPSRRKPKYGYARDRFGRIQERDHYVEGRDVNPYSSSNSLYDREDDNSSVYDGWD